MAIAGKILIVLGAGLLLLAGIFFLDAVVPSGGWGLGGPRFGLIVAGFPGVPGVCALLVGIYLARRARTRRELNAAMEWSSRPLLGSSRMGPAHPSGMPPSMFSPGDRKRVSQRLRCAPMQEAGSQPTCQMGSTFWRSGFRRSASPHCKSKYRSWSVTRNCKSSLRSPRHSYPDSCFVAADVSFPVRGGA